MIPYSTSPGRKFMLALLFLIVLATGTVLLTGCPGTTRAGNQTIVAPAQSILDSAWLMNNLEFISSAATEGREAGSPGNLLAQAFIEQKFDSLRLRKTGDSYLQPFKLRSDSTRMGHNVVGMIRGTTYPDSYIVISAHYDHLGKRNGQIYYGADDDASGTANLLALAQYFSQNPPKHSLIFAAFDAEEKGLVGSRYFVDNLPVPQSSIMIDVNMDMISRNDNNEIYACGIYHYPFLKKYVDTIQAITPVSIRFGHDDPSKGNAQDWTSQSDHYPFHLKKIPFLYFGVEDHPDYHKPTDTFDKINKSFYYAVCTMIANTVLLLDRQQQLQ